MDNSDCRCICKGYNECDVCKISAKNMSHDIGSMNKTGDVIGKFLFLYYDVTIFLKINFTAVY